MKRFLALCVFTCTFFICASVYAQTAKVIGLKGAVMVKESRSAPWQRAKTLMYLEKNSEIQTKEAAECILAFDEELKNILTITENSHIKLESIRPGRIALPQGRVFSLIDNISKAEKFEIRTPTAIAGARGTGWETEFRNDITSIACFEDTIEVGGIDRQGNVTDTMEVDSGLELQIGAEGRLGETAELNTERVQEWNEVRNNIESVRESVQKESFEPASTGPTPPAQSSDSQADSESNATEEASMQDTGKDLNEDMDLSELRDTSSSRDENPVSDIRENTRELSSQEDRRSEESVSTRSESKTETTSSSRDSLSELSNTKSRTQE